MTKTRVFSDNFVNAQRQIFKECSEEAGEYKHLLNEDKTEEILRYMPALEVDGAGNITSSQSAEDYYGLRDLILETRNTHTRQHSRFHPYVIALNQVAENIDKAIVANQPAFVAANNQVLEKKESQITAGRLRRALDLFGIAGCAIWTIPQQPLTFFNCCRNVPRPDEACCTKDFGGCWAASLESGKIAICDAPASIASLIEDFKEEGRSIERLQAEQPRHQRMV